MSRIDLEGLPLIELREQAPVGGPLKHGGRTVARNGRRDHDARTVHLGEDAMTKKWIAFASVLLLSGTAAVAADWTGGFKTVDVDGSGTIAQTEYEANGPKLKIDPLPAFAAMDTNNNSSIDADEWATAEKMVKAFPVSCKSSKESWCPKQY
jgi:hypothetical protein